jgi:16S rRNA (guanine(966)-N(2))-methyltransferase RsmD
MFAILENMASGWERVLDLFSGSGSLGIEALSRGAGWVDFVEHDPYCCTVIKENLEATGLENRAHVYCSTAVRALSFLEREYDIILMDPPWTDQTIGGFIEQTANSKLAGARTMVVVTHSPHLTLEPAYGPLKMIKERRHGDSFISFFNKEARI